MRKRRRGLGCLVWLLTLALVFAGGLVGLRVLGNSNSALWNRVRHSRAVSRAFEVDIVERFSNRVLGSNLVYQVRASGLVDQLRNGEVRDLLGDNEILQQVREHGSLPNIPSAGAQCDEPLILSAEWGDHDGGNSIAVTPSACVRTSGLAMPDAVWGALVAADPGVDVPGMRDQLVCHMIGAQDKPTWNLEPWRPNVGLRNTVLAMCNP